MADTKQTSGDEPDRGADGPGTELDTTPELDAAEEPADGMDDGDSVEDDSADDDEDNSADDEDEDEDDSVEDDTPVAAAAEGATTAIGENSDDEGEGEDEDDEPAGPYPTRVGWVVAAFLLFWPLAIPALVLSMRTAEANGTGNVRRAKKSSVRALDFSLGAVALGALGIVGLAIGIAAAPAYASSLPPGLVSAARSFVPPALAGPLGITLPADGADLAAPSPSSNPTDDPYAPDPYAEDPYVDPGADPYTEDLAGDPDPLPTSGTGGSESTGESSPPPDTTATTGAEIPDLQVGDCIDTSATSGQTTLYRIPVVSCTTAHGGEIYAETTASDSLAENGAAPTQQALWDAADAYCYPQFTRFVGLRWARSELLYWPIAPSEESWTQGDRRILCVVESENPVTGSLRGAGR